MTISTIRSHLSRRSLLLVAAAMSGAVALPAYAQGSAYPERPVKILVGLTTGGGTDLLARLIGDRLGKKLGQSFVVDNKPGAGGNLAIQMLAQAPADGYTLAMGANYIAINAAFGRNKYDFENDLAYLGNLTTTSNLVLVPANSPFNSLSELLAAGKTKPIMYASPGVGTTPHLGSEQLKEMSGSQMEHIPYKGGASIYADLMAGRVDMYLGNSSSSIPLVKADKLKALAVTGTKRLKSLPSLPTVAEAGLPGEPIEASFMLIAPGKTPPEITARLSDAIEELMDDPDVQKAIENLNMVPTYRSASATKASLIAEANRWKNTIQKTGIKLE